MTPLSELSIPVLVAITGGVVTIIGAIAGAIVSIITAFRQIAKIEAHVNSEKTAAIGRESTYRREIELLNIMLAKQNESAALLAQGRIQDKKIDLETPAKVEIVTTEGPVPVAVVKPN